MNEESPAFSTGGVSRLQVATMQRRDLSPTIDQVAAWIQQAREL
ncbi:DUF4332 domain-containing protein [Coleofasciculus chthonoplastes]